MSRHTTFSFTLVPSREQEQALRRHVGASRFAFNQCLRLVLNALEAKRQAGKNAEPAKVPWSGFDLINAFNAWKRSEAAGGDESGPGLVWRAGGGPGLGAGVDDDEVDVALDRGERGVRFSSRFFLRAAYTARTLGSLQPDNTVTVPSSLRTSSS